MFKHKKCTFCGAKIGKADNFCTFCGVDQTRPSKRSAFRLPLRSFPDGVKVVATTEDAGHVITSDGRYDLKIFSTSEYRAVLDVINSAKKSLSSKNFSINLYNLSYGVIYKPRYVLFEIIIQLFADSNDPLDCFAVAMAYSTQGASWRLKAIEYFEKCIDLTDIPSLANISAISPLQLYSTLSTLYEKEHIYDKALEYNAAAMNAPGANVPYFIENAQKLEAKLQNPKKKRTYKPSAETLQFEEDVTNAALHFIKKCNLEKYK